MKEPGYIAVMYGSGTVDLTKIKWVFPKIDWYEIEARYAAFYGYDSRNHFGKYVLRTFQ